MQINLNADLNAISGVQKTKNMAFNPLNLDFDEILTVALDHIRTPKLAPDHIRTPKLVQK